MSKLSKFLEKQSGGLLKEQKIDSVEDLAKLVDLIPDNLRNTAADYLLEKAGLDIEDLLDRLTPEQKLRAMGWAMRQGQKTTKAKK